MNETLCLSPDGRALIESFEGLLLRAEQDIAGIWTIGYGHTGLQHNDGTVYEGRVITKEQADDLLGYDMHQFERRVISLVKVPLNQNQFDALVSFDFNTGGLTLKGLKPSTLLNCLNQGKIWEASNQFGDWNHVNGREVAGLTRRRNAERDVFCGFGWSRWKD
jgi:lysozyme